MKKTTKAPHPLSDLEEANRLLDNFGRIAAVLKMPQLDFDKRLCAILTIILDYLGAAQGSIMVQEKKTGLVIRAATRPELVGQTQKLGSNSIAAWVVEHHEPLFIPDISKDERFRTKGRSGHYKKNALLSVPIIHKKKVIGIINVTDKLGDRELLKEDVVRLLDFSSIVLSLLVQERLRDEVKKQRDNLRQCNYELQHQQEMRAELSKLLVHDLKGPLSEVVANLDILSYSILDEQREFLESAQIGCNKAVRMVSNLTTIGKIEDGRQQLLCERVDPKAILEESLSSMRGLARIKHIKITTDLPDEELPLIELDRTLILRVMQNLLTNALGYSPPHTAIICGCQLTAKKRQLEFFIQDQGPGIPPTRQQSIFEKYTRISDKQDGLVGTGLGLYFCKLAVELHRGRIGVDSSPASGSRFFFTLPL